MKLLEPKKQHGNPPVPPCTPPPSTDGSPLVSVILPVYNAENFLADALASILQQTYANLEVIVINDGSTDNSEGIIRTFSDSRIKYLKNSANRGLIYTLNYGISVSTGQFIARMDADDISLPDRIATQIGFLQENPDHGACGSFYQIIDEKGTRKNIVNLPVTDPEARSFLYFGNCFCHSTMLGHASLFREYRYLEDKILAEDFDLWCRMIPHTKMANLPVSTLLYRIHNNNISTRKQQTLFETTGEINKMALDNLGIGYSAQELRHHIHFTQFRSAYFQDPMRFRELKKWLIRLTRFLEEKPGLNRKVLSRVILRRWFVICFQTGRYFQLFSPGLAKRFKGLYLIALFRKGKDALGPKKEGIDY